MARRSSDDDVPRLPRGRGFTLSTSQLLRIVAVAAALLALIVLQKPCASSVSKFVTSFGPVDAGVVPSDGRRVDLPNGVRLRADMTPAEMEEAIARAKALAANAAANADAGVPDAAAAPDAGVLPADASAGR